MNAEPAVAPAIFTSAFLTPAILLAAGASARMGAVKALLPLEGGVPAVCHLAGLYERECGLCLVVTGFHAESIERALASSGCGRPVNNPQPERGQLSSLQCGLHALQTIGHPPAWFLFAPVDCFDIDAAILIALRTAMCEAPDRVLLCIPEFEGRHGHPVAARWPLAAEFLALAPTDMARTVTRRHRDRTTFVPVENARILTDYDTPANFRARAARTGISGESSV